MGSVGPWGLGLVVERCCVGLAFVDGSLCGENTPMAQRMIPTMKTRWRSPPMMRPMMLPLLSFFRPLRRGGAAPIGNGADSSTGALPNPVDGSLVKPVAGSEKAEPIGICSGDVMLPLVGAMPAAGGAPVLAVDSTGGAAISGAAAGWLQEN